MARPRRAIHRHFGRAHPAARGRADRFLGRVDGRAICRGAPTVSRLAGPGRRGSQRGGHRPRIRGRRIYLGLGGHAHPRRAGHQPRCARRIDGHQLLRDQNHPDRVQRIRLHADVGPGRHHHGRLSGCQPTQRDGDAPDFAVTPDHDGRRRPRRDQLHARPSENHPPSASGLPEFPAQPGSRDALGAVGKICCRRSGLIHLIRIRVGVQVRRIRGARPDDLLRPFHPGNQSARATGRDCRAGRACRHQHPTTNGATPARRCAVRTAEPSDLTRDHRRRRCQR